MKKSNLALLLTSLMLIMPATAADVPNDKGFISVSYSAEKEVAPDTVEFSVSIRTSDKKSMQEASNKNKEISNKVYEYFKSNVNTANGDFVKTSNYSANKIYTTKDGKNYFDRYEIVNNIFVHTKSLDKVSVMLDKSVELGATNVNNLNFSLSNKDGICEDMLLKAGKQARNRANVVAGAVGSSVVGIKEVRTSCSLNQMRVGYSNVRYLKSSNALAASASVADSSPTSIEAGNINVYVGIDADFYLK